MFGIFFTAGFYPSHVFRTWELWLVASERPSVGENIPPLLPTPSLKGQGQTLNSAQEHKGHGFFVYGIRLSWVLFEQSPLLRSLGCSHSLVDICFHLTKFKVKEETHFHWHHQTKRFCPCASYLFPQLYIAVGQLSLWGLPCYGDMGNGFSQSSDKHAVE